VTITQKIKEKAIAKVIEADWATKAIGCDMSRDNKEIPGSRQILKLGSTKSITNEPDTPMTVESQEIEITGE